MQLSSAVDRAAVLVAVESVLLVVVGIGYGLEGVTGDAVSLVGVEVGALLIAASGVLLLLAARGLLRRRRWSRAPVVAVQLLAVLTVLSLLPVLPAAVSVPLLVVPGTVLASLLTREARLAFPAAGEPEPDP